ncbi:hypothetical protein ACIQVN_28230 [Streptomyces cyaneofuscatus]
MVWFQQVAEPKLVKNRWHLDLKFGGGRDVPADGHDTLWNRRSGPT